MITLFVLSLFSQAKIIHYDDRIEVSIPYTVDPAEIVYVRFISEQKVIIASTLWGKDTPRAVDIDVPEGQGDKITVKLKDQVCKVSIGPYRLRNDLSIEVKPAKRTVTVVETIMTKKEESWTIP